MLTKFWENVSSQLAKRWLDHLVSPAALFWAGGVAACAVGCWT